METILKVKNLKKYFGRVKAIDGVSFEVEKGEILGFLGPNGAGKTTTIRCLLDFIRPSNGEIEIFGYSSRNPDFYKSRSKIGYLIAGSNLVEQWTGYDHLSYQEALHGESKIKNELIKKFSFDPKPKVKNLSTGNRQKLGLIMTLMSEPEFLVMDEPTASLDPILQEEFYKIIRKLSSEGVTVFMSSHNLAEVEKVCSKVAMIKSGKLITVQKISALEGKKIHSVKITFSEKVSKDLLVDKNTEIQEEIPNGFELSVKGEMDAFIKKIAKLKIESISIMQANLEEIFLEFYKK
ncbi:MAG: ABC transporter ATP-binding protein [Candidatus Berkelbacteria bacterium]|nr:ABC transporter ATP-binding protein [Candidatus Berkelbacteria bacterium]